MHIAQRIRRVREIRGWKQTAIASSMSITQQAYSCLEQGANNARLNTLNRFCEVMNITLHFLLSDIPITEEMVANFGNKSLIVLVTENIKLNADVETYRSLITNHINKK